MEAIMGYRSDRASEKKSGCSSGCGCFTLGFLGGLSALPILLFLLISFPWVGKQLDHVYDRKNLSRQIEKMAIKISSTQKKDNGVMDEADVSCDEEIPATGDGMTRFNRSLVHEGVRIQYRCTSRSDTDQPFIHGLVDNRRETPIRKLILETTFFTNDGSPSQEDFEIIKASDLTALPPGKARRFVIHPRVPPMDWHSEKMKLSVKKME